MAGKANVRSAAGTSENNELQAPHRVVINLGSSGAPTQIARAKSCKTRRERRLEDESGLGADDFCNSETLGDILGRRPALPWAWSMKEKFRDAYKFEKHDFKTF